MFDSRLGGDRKGDDPAAISDVIALNFTIVKCHCARSGQTAGGTPLLERLDVRVGEQQCAIRNVGPAVGTIVPDGAGYAFVPAA
jgi:hypothetical protein